jgi:transcription initiation factor TFIIIB Brf1 subunit/transcription initiation factor TFIIB
VIVMSNSRLKLRKINEIARKWQRATGASDAAMEHYKTGYQPYYNIIQKLHLPPRRKGDPANLERLRVLNEALRREKTRGTR